MAFSSVNNKIIRPSVMVAFIKIYKGDFIMITRKLIQDFFYIFKDQEGTFLTIDDAMELLDQPYVVVPNSIKTNADVIQLYSFLKVWTDDDLVRPTDITIGDTRVRLTLLDCDDGILVVDLDTGELLMELWCNNEFRYLSDWAMQEYKEV